jgi:hypothetical protein
VRLDTRTTPTSPITLWLAFLLIPVSAIWVMGSLLVYARWLIWLIHGGWSMIGTGPLMVFAIVFGIAHAIIHLGPGVAGFVWAVLRLRDEPSA